MITISIGISGLALLFYAFVEVLTFKYKNMSFLHGVIIYLIYQRSLAKMIPKGWKNNTKLYDFGSIRMQDSKPDIESEPYGSIYSVLQQLDFEADGRRVYTFVYINWRGAIIKNDLADVCRQHEETMDQELLKSFKRDIYLEELGI
jgi:hypothetical protein